ncbi:ABC transporter permease [Tatumella citrea]|uniref:Diguanylate cyclase n=1 Tax=Tatumella citrea TaxID=53336 RepID=A0A1Y0LP43_TATCI|nr:ABC transporter permease [Tatumella citrea]ARU95726.1 diguanylate cyclase [Tatumella citrea]ARU99766.1 diguanylate cyclase [Tatumella citrea]
MLNFLLRRSGQSVVVLFLVSVIGFAALNLAPGGPLSQYALTPGMSQQTLHRLAEQMGLNRPLPVQYFDWLSHLLRGDWGRSYRDGQPVLHIIFSHLPATLLLMVTSTLLAVTIGVWVGVKSAVRRYSLFDDVATMASMIALSIPTFWFGLVAIYFFSLKLHWFPAGNMYTIGDGSVGDILHHLVLPVLVLTFVDIAVWSRYMRSATLETINQEFVKTARAKGLSPRQVLLKHVVRNALLPMVALAGMQLPTILGGALVAETVFTWPGMGRLFLDSLGYSDYPVVMGLLMFSAIMVLVGNLLADVITALIDPRIRPE